MNNNVYIEYRKGSDYPRTGFNPSKRYPEYLFGYEIQEHNDVYDMVRSCLIGMGLDKEHFGTSLWNPMGRYIKPGDHVLIKPNWVMHFNGANVKKNAMECLVTHPSCLRAICDYCLIALKGEGQIIIGDAPMQDCDLPVLLDKAKYNDVLKFYQEKKQPVVFKDFRKYQSTFDSNKVIINKIYQNGKGVDVNFDDLSIHERRNGKRVYQVDNYDKDETAEYHGTKHHIYSINSDVLDADVIINFCKPKSHRLAGFTAVMKNMVGVCYNKASLPHRVEGSVEEGGDAYLNPSKRKRIIDSILERKIKHEDRHKIFLATLDRYLYGVLLLLERRIGKDPYIKGIWYGNDTIWRTVVDLNYIEQYADKKGKIKNERQREILNFGDMVIAGDHNGPCQPEPKQLGVIVAGENAITMDLAICKMIGFPYEKIPMTRALLNHEADYLFGNCVDNINIISNVEELQASLSDIDFPNEWSYYPHEAWVEALK